MRSIWTRFTVVRYCMALMLGIGLQIFADYTLKNANFFFLIGCGVLALSIVALYLFSNLKLNLQFRFQVLNGVVLNLTLIALGYIMTWLYAGKNSVNNFDKVRTEQSVFEVMILEPPLQKDKVISVPVSVDKVYNQEKFNLTTGKILLSFTRDSLSEQLKYGDVLLIKSSIAEFDEPKNPGEFSFKLYQSFHNIYHRGFVKPKQWALVGQGAGSRFFSYIYAWRGGFLNTIKRYVKTENELGVATAIMLGYRDFINGDVIRAYSSSGALHVLSVSGLHVATMFLMINIAFSWMDHKGRRYVIAKAIIVVGLIWIYTCLTGLSPSVLRAAMMFSLMQLASLINRNLHMFNVLAGSAIILMIFNPYIITEIGFRLSYLAVLGIVYLHPKISSLWLIVSPRPPKYKLCAWYQKPFIFLRHDLWWFLRYALPDFVWQLTSVSLAAQIATAPLGLYYFHQFPVMFLISNWVVIPVGNLILFSGTFMFLVSGISYVGDFAGIAFNKLLIALNNFIFWIDSLSFALIDRISILMLEMILIYALFLAVVLLTERFTKAYRGKLVLGSVFIMLVLATSNAFERITFPRQKQLVVFHVPRQSAISIIDGEKSKSLFDKALKENSSSILFHIQHHFWDRGVKQELDLSQNDFLTLPFGKLIVTGGKKIALIDTVLMKVDRPIENKLQVDLVVLSQSPNVFISNLRKLVDFDELVFDTSNKTWKTRYWKTDCEKMGIKYWDVADKGAYVLNL